VCVCERDREKRMCLAKKRRRGRNSLSNVGLSFNQSHLQGREMSGNKLLMKFTFYRRDRFGFTI